MDCQDKCVQLGMKMPVMWQIVFNMILKVKYVTTNDNIQNINVEITSAVWKVRGLAAVHSCYAEGGSDCYAKL
jgi:hypothetical protein